MRFFDCHCDTVLRCYQKGGHLADSAGHWSLDKIKDFTGAAQFFACFGEPEDMPGRRFGRFSKRRPPFCAGRSP